MPRVPRLAIPNGVYHVTNRGLDRSPIVREEADRWDWYRQFDRAASRCRWRVFAYALMDNHFHIFLRTPQPNLSGGMHDFESGFASLVNRRHERVGPVFQGRFHAVLIESESHLWEVSRYVHLNPFRAGLTRQPACYTWSSYRYYLNPHGAPEWLDWQTVLSELGRKEAAARVAYKRFVEAGLNSPIPNPLADAKEGLVLGSDAFVARILDEVGDLADGATAAKLARLRRIPTVDEIMERVASEFECTLGELEQPGRHGNVARQVAIYLCREVGQVPLETLSARFAVSRSAITDTVRRFHERMQNSAALGARLAALRQSLEG
jgi:putative transposase